MGVCEPHHAPIPPGEAPVSCCNEPRSGFPAVAADCVVAMPVDELGLELEDELDLELELELGRLPAGSSTL